MTRWREEHCDHKPIDERISCFEIKTSLGEGPYWSPRDTCLYWVDVNARRLFSHNINSGSYQFRDVSDRVTALAETDQSICLLSSCGLIGLEQPGFNDIAHSHANMSVPKNGINDGKIDPAGRFWASVVCRDSDGPQGGLYVRERDGNWIAKDRDIWGGNGMGWSPDGKYMYFADTIAQAIYRYDFDVSSSDIDNRVLLVDLSQSDGKPDGLTIDAEGMIWCAIWDGWRVCRYTSDGEVDEVLKLPVPRPTSCIFGGADFGTLFVTSASYGLSGDQTDEAPLSGCLFAVDTGVQGKAPSLLQDHETQEFYESACR